jgi:flagellar hook-associated protein 2
VSGADNKFAIDSQSGILRVTAALDYETRSQYSLVVQVVDVPGSRDGVDIIPLTATATTATAFQVTVENNQTTAKENVDAFVAAFNKISASLTELTKYDAASSKSSTLQGDSAARGLQNTLKRLVTGAGTGSTAFARLSDIGVELQRDGTLKVNSTKLTTALEQPDQVSAFFLDASGMAANLKAFANNALGTEGLIASRNQALQTASTRTTKEVERVNTRAALVEKRLLQQYSLLDSKVATNQGLNSLVSQWVNSLSS